ncbi:MAG: hypothetical protein ACREDR_42635 [Blastocatellia bacterium]
MTYWLEQFNAARLALQQRATIWNNSVAVQSSNETSQPPEQSAEQVTVHWA